MVLSIESGNVFGQYKFKELDQRVIAAFDLRVWSEFMKGLFGCMNPTDVRDDYVE